MVWILFSASASASAFASAFSSAFPFASASAFSFLSNRSFLRLVVDDHQPVFNAVHHKAMSNYM